MKPKYRIKNYDDCLFTIQEKTFWGWKDYGNWYTPFFYFTKESVLDRVKELNAPKPKATYEYPDENPKT